MLDTLKWLADDLRWWFWKSLNRCPDCHQKEVVAKCGTGCVNADCKLYDTCVALES